MDFQARLLKVGNDLRKEEVRALVFLCSDILGCNPAAVQSAGDLFSRLSDQDHLSEERPHLLVELLGIIQRTKLLRDHNLPRTGAQDLISPYRKLLYSLSEELTADDLKNIKFLLNNKLPRGKLEGVTTLEVFMELEHRALISDTDLGFLESIIQPVCPVLLEKINQFNAQNSAMNHGLVAQETGRPIAETDPQPPTEMPSFNRCVSVGETGKKFPSVFLFNLTIEEMFLDDTQSVMINSWHADIWVSTIGHMQKFFIFVVELYNPNVFFFPPLWNNSTHNRGKNLLFKLYTKLLYSLFLSDLSVLSEPVLSPPPSPLLDRRSVINDQDESEDGSPALSASRAENNSRASANVKSDASVIFPQENQTSSRAETSVTGSADAGVETYLMTATKRGRCLIINNCNFRVSRLKKREGTMVDEASLDKVLKWLGFEVEIQRDCTSKKMLSLIQELAKTSQRDWDCVMCCVLSHGLEGGVYGVDGGTVEIRKLMEPFSGTNCPSLAGKPKIFFIQACQGSRQQDVVYTDAGTPAHGYVDNNAVQAKECIPSHADFLLGMATVPSFVSFRDGASGTWYIQSLCQNLAHMVPRGCNLISILTKVNADVSKKVAWIDSRLKTQMPQPAFTLTKNIVFPAPNTPHPVL
ncbi:caspase-8 [Takifugu flavidus]|uniref:caspase-8 n=1 Tax=Takifugu flavidus TaxID=433684 RepID=UPI0025447A10|nr:caspase-8 [Takifugu flavidus]